MTDIVVGQARLLEQNQTAGVIPARPSRSLTRRATRAAEDGLVAATRVYAASYVAHTAIGHLGTLCAEEARLVRETQVADPIQAEAVAARARSIVDAFTRVAGCELRRMAQ